MANACVPLAEQSTITTQTWAASTPPMEQAHTRCMAVEVVDQRVVDNRVDHTGTHSSQAQLLFNRAIWRTTIFVTCVTLHAFHHTTRFRVSVDAVLIRVVQSLNQIVSECRRTLLLDTFVPAVSAVGKCKCIVASSLTSGPSSLAVPSHVQELSPWTTL